MDLQVGRLLSPPSGMALKPSNNIWIRRQQCPCGDWKCYIRFEGDDQASVGLHLATNETASSSSSLSSGTEPIFTPYVGQVFRSDEEAFEYYSNFARKNGFSIRKARSTESQNLGIYRRDFVCYRSGFNQPRKKANVEHPRDRKSVRCGCDAKLYLTKEIVAGVVQWYVSQFSNVHNHELLEDDQVRLLPAYRKIQMADQERILLLSKAGFPVNRIVKLLELEKGIQPGQLPFIEKDVRNFIRTCKKTVQENDALLSEKRENDILELLEACRAMADKEADFSYNYTSDENEKVGNIAWSYADSAGAFSVFGDVITFDTTYRSITYGLSLGIWFGTDNYGKAIVFGCALLKDDSADSFAWALQTFVRFMRGRHPQTIVSDIDSGLRDAVARELPNTKHTISIWHVLSKLSSWFSAKLGSHYGDFKMEIDMLCQLESMEDFEHQWNLMLGRFGLAADKHAALLFSYRTSWPISFVRGCFLARAMTAEYSKSVDAFLKRIISSQTCLQVFFEQVVIASRFGNSPIENFQYMPLKTCMPMEEHARIILTPYAFNVLQHEIVLSLQYAMDEMANGSYLVRHYKKMDGECFVIWIPEDEQIHCSCKEFEHSGLLCRHSIRVLVAKNFFQIPDKYFPLRWRLESSLVSLDAQNITENTNECVQAFHSLAATLLTESLASKERFDFVHKELVGMIDNVRNIPTADEAVFDTANNLADCEVVGTSLRNSEQQSLWHDTSVGSFSLISI
ncbi:putative protein FAR1-RELATED SEQUENCE 10 isoform X2 [Punica granatum]|uniref:Protein FAR1-RELATED SEQUENCE n=2 Tax=Punica granatum TaxID=22663 RepID=A0A6P8EJ63_PUNGR|nr:putative protein FAR1-RELATED SEQUENCE 10 isoform X2 [Punica granatum]